MNIDEFSDFVVADPPNPTAPKEAPVKTPEAGVGQAESCKPGPPSKDKDAELSHERLVIAKIHQYGEYKQRQQQQPKDTDKDFGDFVQSPT